MNFPLEFYLSRQNAVGGRFLHTSTDSSASTTGLNACSITLNNKCTITAIKIVSNDGKTVSNGSDRGWINVEQDPGVLLTFEGVVTEITLVSGGQFYYTKEEARFLSLSLGVQSVS